MSNALSKLRAIQESSSVDVIEQMQGDIATLKEQIHDIAAAAEEAIESCQRKIERLEIRIENMSSSGGANHIHLDAQTRIDGNVEGHVGEGNQGNIR